MNQKIISQFGEIDIYLFDQLQKGKFDDCKTILDAGCGYGRNLTYFLKNGYEVYGTDMNAGAIEAVRQLSMELAPKNPIQNFSVADLASLPYPENYFDVIICSAVLHFARDHQHFDVMLRSCFKVLKPSGFFFARLATNIGIESLVFDLGNGKYLLPDGSERYLTDQKTLIDYTKKLNGELFEPIKTTNVQNLRCMTTWCVRKM